MRPALEIGKRELQSAARDRRALLSALIFPLLGPAILALMLGILTRDAGPVSPLELAIVGQDNAPSVVQAIARMGVKVTEGPEDPEAAVLQGEYDAVLVIPEEWPTQFTDARPATLVLVVDASRPASMATVRRARSVLSAAEQDLAAARLIARGIDPTLIDVVEVEHRDLSTPATLASGLLDVVVMFLILAAFVCSMHVAIEATAGERERRSLEPLLVNPVSRIDVVTGKWAAGVVFSMGGVLVSLVAIASLMSTVRLEDIGLRMDFGASVLACMLIASVPVAFLAAALQMMVASFARSFKEAQTYLSLTMFAPMVPGIAAVVSPGPSDAGSGVPLLAQQLLLSDLLTGQSVGLPRYIQASLPTIALAALLLAVTVWLFRRERVLFSS